MSLGDYVCVPYKGLSPCSRCGSASIRRPGAGPVKVVLASMQGETGAPHTLKAAFGSSLQLVTKDSP